MAYYRPVTVDTGRATVGFASPEGLGELCGERDTNLRWLESRLGLSVVARGTALHLVGEHADVRLARAVLQEIAVRIEAGEVVRGDALRRLVELRAGHGRSLLHALRGGRDLGNVLGRTANQRRYIRAISAAELTFGVGPAGTGKTYLAVACGVAALRRGEARRIVLTRPAVEAGERLGFLPGDLAAKVNPYLRPLFDALIELLDRDKVERLIEREELEVAPLAFMRGRTLSACYVILDEAQNCTVQQMAMLLTRLGPDSRCIVTGDPSQSDLPRSQRPGLDHAIGLLEGIEGIEVVRFSESDVVRHPLVARIAAAYAGDTRRSGA